MSPVTATLKIASPIVPGIVLLVALSGCAYRLPGSVPLSQEQIKVIAKSPSSLTIHINTGEASARRVPADGRITVNVPAFRPSCGVYLFDWIRVGGSDPLRDWTIAVSSKNKVLRTLSFRKLKALPTDAGGFHLLKVPD
jgi:hypothetical protein